MKLPSLNDLPQPQELPQVMINILRHDGPSGIYYLLLGEEIVYVGQSVNVFGRILQGHRDKEFNRILVRILPAALLDYVENAEIWRINPKLNNMVQPPSGWISQAGTRSKLRLYISFSSHSKMLEWLGGKGVEYRDVGSTRYFREDEIENLCRTLDRMRKEQVERAPVGARLSPVFDFFEKLSLQPKKPAP